MDNEAKPPGRILPPLRARLGIGTEALSSALIRVYDTVQLFRYASNQLQGGGASSDFPSWSHPFDSPLCHLVSSPSNIQLDEDGLGTHGGRQEFREEERRYDCPLIYHSVNCKQITSRSGHHLQFEASFDVEISPYVPQERKHARRRFLLTSSVCLSSLLKNGSAHSGATEELRSIPSQSTTILISFDDKLSESAKESSRAGQEKQIWRNVLLSTRVSVEDVLAIVPNISAVSARFYIITEEYCDEAVDRPFAKWSCVVGVINLAPINIWPGSKDDATCSQFDLECEAQIPKQQVLRVHTAGTVGSRKRHDDVATYLKFCGRPSEVLTTLSALGQRYRGSVLPDASQYLQGLELCVKSLDKEAALWRRRDSSTADEILAMIETDETLGSFLEAGFTSENDLAICSSDTPGVTELRSRRGRYVGELTEMESDG